MGYKKSSVLVNVSGISQRSGVSSVSMSSTPAFLLLLFRRRRRLHQHPNREYKSEER